jgi:hypothetical protein
MLAATADPGRVLAAAGPARLHNSLAVRLNANPFQLIVAIGTYAHTFRLFEGRLCYSLALGWDKFPDPKGPTAMCPFVAYDASRFPAGEVAHAGPWWAVLDRLGQVLLFTSNGLVATFLVRRERAAAWIPGGVFWGDTELTGGPSSPDAAVRVGQAIESSRG